MELPLFHNQSVISYNIEKPPEGFRYFKQRTVSHKIFCDFYRWAYRTLLYNDLVFRQCYSPEFEEYSHFVYTDTGWRLMVDQLDEGDIDPLLIQLREFVIGDFYVSEENYALILLRI